MPRREREPIRDPSVTERMDALLDLFGVAMKMARQNLHREHPTESPEQVEERLAEWLRSTPWPHSGPGIRIIAERTSS
jgi:Rv0078B-related antitoxin